MAARVYFVLDKSGSMAAHADDTIGGMNAFIREQSDNTVLSLNTFNDKVTTVYADVSKSAVTPLTNMLYRPMGGTALLDAIGYTIRMATNIEPTSWADQDDDSTVTIVMLTDGNENSSKEYTHAHIRDLVELKRLQGWRFVFLGANQDAFLTAKDIGIDPASTLNFDTGVVDTAIRSAGSAVARMTSGTSNSISFTDLERTASQPMSF